MVAQQLKFYFPGAENIHFIVNPAKKINRNDHQKTIKHKQ